VMTNHRLTPRESAPTSCLVQLPRQRARRTDLCIGPSPKLLRNHAWQIAQDVPPGVVLPEPARRTCEPTLLQEPEHRRGKWRSRPAHGAADPHNTPGEPASPQDNLFPITL
jgi:hypothetical protein